MLTLVKLEDKFEMLSLAEKLNEPIQHVKRDEKFADVQIVVEHEEDEKKSVTQQSIEKVEKTPLKEVQQIVEQKVESKLEKAIPQKVEEKENIKPLIQQKVEPVIQQQKKITSIPRFYFPKTSNTLSKEELKRDLV